MLIAGFAVYRHNLASGWRKNLCDHRGCRALLQRLHPRDSAVPQGADASGYRADTVGAAVSSGTVTSICGLRGNRNSRCYENESCCRG